MVYKHESRAAQDFYGIPVKVSIDENNPFKDR